MIIIYRWNVTGEVDDDDDDDIDDDDDDDIDDDDDDDDVASSVSLSYRLWQLLSAYMCILSFRLKMHISAVEWRWVIGCDCWCDTDNSDDGDDDDDGDGDDDDSHDNDDSHDDDGDDDDDICYVLNQASRR